MAAGGVSITLDRQRRDSSRSPPTSTARRQSRAAPTWTGSALAAIDRPDVRVVVNPGGSNERFDRANLKQAPIRLFPDNTAIFREVAEGRADVMITDGVETRLQQKLNPGLCAIHPDKPFDRAEKGWLLPRSRVQALRRPVYPHPAAQWQLRRDRREVAGLGAATGRRRRLSYRDRHLAGLVATEATTDGSDGRPLGPALNGH